jgi:hypothetical protein
LLELTDLGRWMGLQARPRRRVDGSWSGDDDGC